MSLYQYMYKYFNCPVCHHVIHAGDVYKDKEACLRMDGLIKCSIVPPKRLYHPVLHFRANHKLMFCLCRTCVLTSNTGECCHKTDEQRDLNGTWVTDEVRLAVQKGYRILEVYELYEYVPRYDAQTQGRRPVCRLHRHLSEFESRGKRLSRLGSNHG